MQYAFIIPKGAVTRLLGQTHLFLNVHFSYTFSLVSKILSVL